MVVMITDDAEKNAVRMAQQGWYLYVVLKNENNKLAQVMSYKLTSKKVAIYFSF